MHKVLLAFFLCFSASIIQLQGIVKNQQNVDDLSLQFATNSISLRKTKKKLEDEIIHSSLSAKKYLKSEIKQASLLVASIQKILKEIELPLQCQKVLVFAPHPDDDIIGCGGSIAKHMKNGDNVSIVYMTSGETGSSNQFKKKDGCPYSKEELAVIREQEAISAELILGVKNLYFLRYPTRCLTYDKKSVKQLVELIRQEQPDVVYIPHHSDAHSDHIATHELVVEAIRKAAWHGYQECQKNLWRVSTIFCYEIWTPLQKVTYSEDISEFMELKLQALRQHVSQLADFKYDNAIEGLNYYRGSMKKAGKYVEAFQIFKTYNDNAYALIADNPVVYKRVEEAKSDSPHEPEKKDGGEVNFLLSITSPMNQVVVEG